MVPIFIQVLHQAFLSEVMAIFPIIITLLMVGLVTGFFQGALQIEDATFNLLPKTFAIIVIMLLGGFGALAIFEQFTVKLVAEAPSLVRQSWN